MHSLLTSIVLCFVAHTAIACEATTAVIAHTSVLQTAAATISLPTTTAGSAATRSGGELIRTASAGTRDELIKTAAAGTRDTPAMRAPQLATAAKSEPADDEQPRRTGTAMLLAAIALMSAIALRRGGFGQ